MNKYELYCKKRSRPPVYLMIFLFFIFGFIVYFLVKDYYRNYIEVPKYLSEEDAEKYISLRNDFIALCDVLTEACNKDSSKCCGNGQLKRITESRDSLLRESSKQRKIKWKKGLIYWMCDGVKECPNKNLNYVQ